ncbi:hypothetical protein [Pseudofrankia sp. BMG5.37]|uniref:hypothetical protein n=1 Tax=Pseudofrankia sp. BMG5.37 TaxID=3050035 RepID=UPI00289489B2|nr:hypothetical protein [Pseudofrankia sp. BMG5.37]MDT3438287.1 hypothetical protein [Pseudofrankia sp. BMG5.37]
MAEVRCVWGRCAVDGRTLEGSAGQAGVGLPEDDTRDHGAIVVWLHEELLEDRLVAQAADAGVGCLVDVAAAANPGQGQLQGLLDAFVDRLGGNEEVLGTP